MKSKVVMGAVLCLSGSTLDMSTVQSSIPASHKRPTADVVAGYITAKGYNPQRFSRDWNRSETRKKEILAKINSIRSDVRKQVDSYHKNKAAENLLKTIACTMENRTLNRDRELKHERAQQLHVPARLILVDVLRKRKGMPVMDLSEV